MFRSSIIGILSWVLSIFLYSPRLTLYLGEPAVLTRRDDLLAQCINPLVRNLNEPILAYRIIQPLIARALGWCGERKEILSLMGSPGIAYIALMLTLIIFHFSLRKRFSTSLSTLATFGLATTQVTQWVNTHWGHPDSLTFLPISLLLLSRNKMVVILATSIGFLNDERMILSLPFILLWWWPKKHSLKAYFQNLCPIIFSLFVGLAIAFLIRIFLQHGLIGPGINIYDEYINGTPYDPYLTGYFRLFEPSKWLSLLVVTFFGFRWLWIIPFLALLGLLKKNISIPSYIFIFSTLFCLIASYSVADVSRSCAFFFPIFPVSMKILKHEFNWNESKLKFWIKWIIGLNVLTPALKVFAVPPNWLEVNPFEWSSPALPLPANLWRWFTAPNGAITW